MAPTGRERAVAYALAPDVAGALRSAARLGPFFTVGLPGEAQPADGWQSFAALTGDEGSRLLARQVSATAAQLGTDLRRPVASMLHLGAAAAFCSPLLAAAATHGVVPDIDRATVRWRYPPAGPLQFALADAPPGLAGPLPALADHLISTALDGLLGPFTVALTEAVPLPQPTLVGNVFSALAAAARLIVPSDAGARARALVDLVARAYPPLRDAGELNWRAPEGSGYFRRRNCCLFYQIPGAGTCGDCILGSATPVRQTVTEHGRTH